MFSRYIRVSPMNTIYRNAKRITLSNVIKQKNPISNKKDVNFQMTQRRKYSSSPKIPEDNDNEYIYFFGIITIVLFINRNRGDTI